MREDTATVPLEATAQPQLLLSRKPPGKKKAIDPLPNTAGRETLESDSPGWERRKQIASLPRAYEWEAREQISWAFHVFRNNGPHPRGGRIRCA